MSVPRFSPIDDDVQAWNEDEYEVGYQARQDDAPSSIFSNPELKCWLGPTPIWIIFMLEAASSELGIRGTARLPNPAAISSEMSIRRWTTIAALKRGRHE